MPLSASYGQLNARLVSASNGQLNVRLRVIFRSRFVLLSACDEQQNVRLGEFMISLALCFPKPVSNSN